MQKPKRPTFFLPLKSESLRSTIDQQKSVKVQRTRDSADALHPRIFGVCKSLQEEPPLTQAGGKHLAPSPNFTKPYAETNIKIKIMYGYEIKASHSYRHA